MTIEIHEKAREGSPAIYLVKEGGTVIGMLEKYRDTRTEHHPWKAYLGYGASRRHLGAFYQSRAGWPGNDGGRDVAINAIFSEYRGSD